MNFINNFIESNWKLRKLRRKYINKNLIKKINSYYLLSFYEKIEYLKKEIDNSSDENIKLLYNFILENEKLNLKKLKDYPYI